MLVLEELEEAACRGGGGEEEVTVLVEVEVTGRHTGDCGVRDEQWTGQELVWLGGTVFSAPEVEE